MQKLIEVAFGIQTFCEKKQWQFCFIGGLAVQHWGESRLTKDVDLTLLTGFGNERPFIEELLNDFIPRIPDAKDFAENNRVLLLKTTNNIGIDITFAGLPFEEVMINRAVSVKFTDQIALRLCSAEDLIILKAFASREIDWHDIKGIVTRQGSQTLNWNYIDAQMPALAEAKEDPTILTKLKNVRKQ